MQNLKIRVNSADESREAQELFFKLGGSWAGYKKIHDWPEIKQLYLDENYITFSNDINFFVNDPSKEIKLPELRAMVNPMKEYLVKNIHGEYVVVDHHSGFDVNELIEIPEGAECLTKCKDHNGDEWILFWKGDYKFCVGHDKEWFHFESGVSEYLNDWSGLAKVIWQRAMVKPLKEYLDKKPDGSYELIVSNGGCVDRDWIEIPEGAEAFGYTGIVHTFYKNDFRSFFNENTDGQWDERSETWVGRKEPVILWQRDQDEPFLTPECTLNDQYAEIERVRQAIKDNVNHPSHYADSAIECIDAMEAMMTPEQFIGYLRGNLFKYQWRYEKKNGIEDLKKAQWYLEKLTVKVAEKNAPF